MSLELDRWIKKSGTGQVKRNWMGRSSESGTGQVDQSSLELDS